MKQLRKETILKTLDNNKSVLNNFGVEKLTLFGLFARDEQNENSDIDFLVTFQKDRGSYDDFIKVKHLLEDLVEEEFVREELKPYIYESELKPEFIEEIRRIEKEKHIGFNSIKELDALIEKA